MTADDNDTGIPMAPEAGDSAPAAAPGSTDGTDPNDLLGELSKAMHLAAQSQHTRIGEELQRSRATQVEAIKARASSDSAELKKLSAHDVGEIDAWATTATQLIATERARRMDAQRETLNAEILRQEVMVERKVLAVEAAVKAHQAELDVFFGQLQRESDPVEIARLASGLPSFPSLTEAANTAMRQAAAEFATADKPAAASSFAPAESFISTLPGGAPAAASSAASAAPAAPPPAAPAAPPAPQWPGDTASSGPAARWTGDEPSPVIAPAAGSTDDEPLASATAAAEETAGGADAPSDDEPTADSTSSESDTDDAAVSSARLMSVTGAAASSEDAAEHPGDDQRNSTAGSSNTNGSGITRPWPAPGAIAVHAGAYSGTAPRQNESNDSDASGESDESGATEESQPRSLLHSIPSTRPVNRGRLWNRKPDDDSGEQR